MHRILSVAAVFALAACITDVAPEAPAGPSEDGAPTLDVNPTEDVAVASPDTGPVPQPTPCLAAAPAALDFGGQPVGSATAIPVTVASCGDGPATIVSVGLSDGSHGAFSLPEGDLETCPKAPFVLEAEAACVLMVRFAPDAESEPGTDGVPLPMTGTLEIQAESLDSIAVDLAGLGVLLHSPTPLILIEEGSAAVPTTKLHLDGSQSEAATGDVAQYSWSVEQPPGSASVFLPSAQVPDPTFEVNVAGTYVFTLTVWDELGNPSPTPAVYAVEVSPVKGIHVELTWHTPADPNQNDEGPEAGTDLDLHFLHPLAQGMDMDKDGALDGWFDQPFDCFWFNAHPNWGDFDPEVLDDPSLLRDDTDGAGPELIALESPADVAIYRIGVHQWDDHGFGPSLATVRVYIDGALVFTAADIELFSSDFWEVATLSWPDGEVTPIVGDDGAAKIIPNYQHPYFFQ